MWRLFIQFLVIFVASSQPLCFVHGARKHWRRPTAHGAFNVDLYAYNKPVINQLSAESGQSLPMGQLLEQLSHSSRRSIPTQKSHYRNLDNGQTDNYMARNQAAVSIEAENEDGAVAEDETTNATTDQIIAMPERKQSTDYLEAAIHTTTIATTTSTAAAATIAATTTTTATAAAATIAAINKQLAALQMNTSSKNAHAHQISYSHEFHVQNMGTKKIVLLNSLSNGTTADQVRKPDAELMEKQTQPLKMKLALPALSESMQDSSQEEQQEQPGEVQLKPVKIIEAKYEMMNSSTQEDDASPNAISALSNELAAEPLKQMETMQPAEKESMKKKLSDVPDDRKNRVNDARNMTTIEMKSPVPPSADKGHVKEQTNANGKQQQQEQLKQDQKDKDVAVAADDAKRSDSQHENDGQAAHMPVDKPVRLPSKLKLKSKSKRKQTQTQTQTQIQTQIKTSAPNEIDTKPTMATTTQKSRVQQQSMNIPMVGTTNVKAPLKESPEITPQDIRRPMQKGSKGKLKGKPKRKGSTQRRPNVGSEQEIETTTNWWQILPYAEIRKFLNTIYDSIADDDDERAQRM